MTNAQSYIHEYKCNVGLTKGGYDPLVETVFPSLKAAKTALRKVNRALRKKGAGIGVYKVRIKSLAA